MVVLYAVRTSVTKALDAVGKAITGRSTEVMTRELPDVVIVRSDP